MAKVVITIEDVGDKVKCVCEPSFEAMAFMVRSGHGHTAAHGYALAAINTIMKKSKEDGPLVSKIPRIGRA